MTRKILIRKTLEGTALVLAGVAGLASIFFLSPLMILGAVGSIYSVILIYFFGSIVTYGSTALNITVLVSLALFLSPYAFGKFLVGKFLQNRTLSRARVISVYVLGALLFPTAGWAATLNLLHETGLYGCMYF